MSNLPLAPHQTDNSVFIKVNMIKVISSRPDELEMGFLDELDEDELRLIAALLYNVRLGPGSVFREAAFSLMQKLEDYTDDHDFTHDSGQLVNVKINVMDPNGAKLMTLANDCFEIEV